MKFKVGDKVRVVKVVGARDNWQGKLQVWISVMDKTLGKVYEVVEVLSNRCYLSNCWYYMNESLQKEAPMNQYDDLARRIGNVKAWDKECDDIIGAMGLDKISNYYISIATNNGSAFATVSIHRDGNTTNAVETFKFTSQCEKLEAFKEALMWLLDHSDIKTIVGKEVTMEFEGRKVKAKIIEEI